MQDGNQTSPETPDEGAARRLVRLTSDRADALDTAELERWRAADPRHDRAWRDVVSLWHDAAALRRDEHGLAQPPRRAVAGRRVAVAAGLAGATGLAGWLWDRGGLALLLADMATGTAEIAARTLPDGTRVVLDARSAADLAMAGPVRCVRLQGGGLFADVPAGALFVVEVGPATISLEGRGALAVGRRGGSVQVAVAVGLARLLPRVGAVGVLLGTGQMAELTSAGRGIGSRTVAVSGIAAWRQGRLVAEDRPLPEVVEGLGAYYRGAILLRGAAERLRVSAALDLGDVPAALASLAGVLGIRLDWPAPRVAVLRA